jgi:hypothetical protein
MSEPSSSDTYPAASAAAAPPDEPPGVRLRCHVAPTAAITARRLGSFDMPGLIRRHAGGRVGKPSNQFGSLLPRLGKSEVFQITVQAVDNGADAG